MDSARRAVGRGALPMAPADGRPAADPFARPWRSTALYGFVAWIAIHVCYSIFLLWAYTPDGVLISYGWTYFPDKHWALALPCWTLVSMLTAVVLYAAYNIMHLPDLESVSNIFDEHTRL